MSDDVRPDVGPDVRLDLRPDVRHPYINFSFSELVERFLVSAKV